MYMFFSLLFFFLFHISFLSMYISFFFFICTCSTVSMHFRVLSSVKVRHWFDNMEPDISSPSSMLSPSQVASPRFDSDDPISMLLDEAAFMDLKEGGRPFPSFPYNFHTPKHTHIHTHTPAPATISQSPFSLSQKKSFSFLSSFFFFFKG